MLRAGVVAAGAPRVPNVVSRITDRCQDDRTSQPGARCPTALARTETKQSIAASARSGGRQIGILSECADGRSEWYPHKSCSWLQRLHGTSVQHERSEEIRRKDTYWRQTCR